MESYCVIQFKNQNEKKQVVNILLDIEVDFKVTTDLKNCLAEKAVNQEKDPPPATTSTNNPIQFCQSCNCRCSGNNNVTENRTTGENTVTTVSASTSSENQAHHKDSSHEIRIVTRDKTVRNVTTESTQESGISTDQSIKTQKEVVEKQGVDDVGKVKTTASVVKTKTTTVSPMKRPPEVTKLVSKRVVKEVGVKRPKLMEGSNEVDMTSEDEMETDKWHDKYDWEGRRKLKCRKCGTYVDNKLSSVKCHLILHTPLVEKKNIMEKCFPEFGTKSFRNTCQLCHEVMVKNSSTERRVHSIFHLEYMLYKCNETECDYESLHPGDMEEHGKRLHEKSIDVKDMKIKLTEEQELEIENTMKECFPE